MKQTKFPYYTLLIACFFIQLTHLFAQDSLANAYTDISKTRLVKYIGKTLSSTYIDKKEDPEAVFTSLNFIPGLQHRSTIPNDYVNKKPLLRFNLSNTGDTSMSVYFFPGFYYKSIRLYRQTANGIEKLPNILPSNPDSIGYRMITVGPHDSATFIAALTFEKTYNNLIRPRLVSPDYVEAFASELHTSHGAGDLMTYVFCGLLLMMILFSMANFVQGANPEFLYYSGYALFLGVMLFTKAMYSFHANRVNYFMESYLDFIMQGLGHMFYMFFMRQFLETKTKYRFLYKLYNAGIVLLIVSMLSYSYFHYFSDNFAAENLVENLTKALLLLMILVFLVYSIRHTNDKLLRYLFWGNLCLFVFSLISQVLVFSNPRFTQLPEIFSSSLFYYECGLLLELIFFLSGLNHKNRRQIIEQTKERERLKADNQLKEYEKEIAVYKAQQSERERISADMHDELGSGMTAIRLLSEIARNKMKENTPVEIEKISHSANDVLNKMNAIIWSMNSGNDTLDNLLSYIRSYALEYFDNTPIECKVKTPNIIPQKELTGDKRRNVFLCVKETLNNAWKHSGANTITIDIETNDDLCVRIVDNGAGIDLKNLRQFGNGLNNIARRMESIGGNFKIENKNGTVTTLSLPLD